MKKKIIILSYHFFPMIGGIEIMSLFLANTFFKKDYIVKVITSTQNEKKSVFPFQVIRNPSKTRLLKELLWADVVLENNPSLSLSLPLIFINKPLVTVLHTWINRVDGSNGWQDKFKKLWLKKRVNQVLTVSKALKNEYDVESEVIMNPYNSDIFKVINYIQRKLDFVFLGRLVSDKGVDLAIRLVNKLSREGFNANLTIIGNGPDYKKLKLLSEELNVSDKVVFLGFLSGEDLVKVLNQHKYILVPSVWNEPFGLVALEGMACGCIPIVSDCGGLPEAVGKAGIKFKRGDLESMYEVAKQILENKEQQQEMKSLAVDHLKNHHPSFIGEQYINVVNKLLKNK